jgi:hypothetical protein
MNKIKLSQLKYSLELMSAEEAQQKLEEKIFTDPLFVEYKNKLLLELENAIKNKTNQITLIKNSNKTFNKVLKKILVSKGYTVHEDVITKYKKNWDAYDSSQYTDTEVFLIEF